MKVSESIKALRTEHGWSQEQMAEKLGVSRQAITKWETGAGTPDIENLAAIAQLFGVTTDSLLFGVSANADEQEPARPKSVTSIDVFTEKQYDIKIGCAHSVTMRTVESEKTTVSLSADSITNLERAFKVILDTAGPHFDINIASTGVVADALARKELNVLIELPAAYSKDTEIELYANELRIEGGVLDVEVGGKVGEVWVDDVEGHIELDVPVDMEIWVNNVRGKLDINQIGATSTAHVTQGTPFVAKTRGRLSKRTLRFTRNGEPAESPTAQDAELAIELTGARCELTVDVVS